MFRLSTAAASTSRLLLFGVAGLLATAAAFSALLLGYADLEFRRGDRIGLQRALHIAPLDAGYLAKWSLLAEDPEASIQSLRKAVNSNPWYAWAWIQLGLTAEAAGQNNLAERDLLQAAEVDHGFAPRWALCNYYLRNGEFSPFWRWARAALSIEDADPLPVLRLAWKVSPDVRTVLDQAVPRTDAARRRFLKFVIDEHPLGTDFSAMSGLFAAATPDDVLSLDSYARTLVNAGEVGHAVELWNSMCDRRLLPFTGIHDQTDNLLTNAAFTTAPSGRVFDWHFSPAAGITGENQAPGAFALTLSGSEPEHWRILTQQVPVQPGKSYVLGFKTQLSSGGPATGLAWKVIEGSRVIDGATSGNSAIPIDADARSIQFSPSASLVTIAFDYDRPRGETRLTGQVTLTGLSLRAVDAR